MAINRESVDAYLRDGCGRCEHYKTPRCKALQWTRELGVLRELLLAAGLTEEMKWGSPCYTLDGKNIAMLISLRASCALQFNQGSGLADPDGLLDRAGPNSRYGRLLRFTSLEEVVARREQAAAFIAEAVRLQREGVRIEVPPAQEPVPDELAERLEADPELAAAFAALTPGRRRSHILHVGGAKQAETRVRRVEGCVPVILAGKGFNERY